MFITVQEVNERISRIHTKFLKKVFLVTGKRFGKVYAINETNHNLVLAGVVPARPFLVFSVYINDRVEEVIKSSCDAFQVEFEAIPFHQWTQ